MTGKSEFDSLNQFTELEGKTALVTGASRGIGRAAAAALAKRGAQVALLGRDESNLEETRRLIQSSGNVCASFICDIRQEKNIADSLKAVENQLGLVDILVNNAGIYKTREIANHPLELWNDIIQTNLTSAFLFCRELVSGMVDRRYGRIVNISSISGKVAEIHGGAYSASKFALIGLTQTLALETAGKGVTANAVCPGWVNTEMAKLQLSDPQWCKLNSMTVEESMENARMSVPLMRFIEPAEVAELVCYLCSEKASGITGQSINICGGMCLS